MAVIWGLDLHDVQWYKFKSSYMFGNTDYHMRRTKFIIYQCAMIFLVISESLGTAVLSDYVDQQNYLQKRFPGIDVWNDDYVGIASFNIFVGVLSATVFGAAFFFDLFFPDRYEPRWMQNIWMGGAIFCCVAGLGDALAYTVILSLHGEHIGNIDQNDPALLAILAKDQSKTPRQYKDSGRAIASVVLLWLGWACAVTSTVVMIMFYSYYCRMGTAKSTHARKTMDFKSRNSDLAAGEKVESPVSAPPQAASNNGQTGYTISNNTTNNV